MDSTLLIILLGTIGLIGVLIYLLRTIKELRSEVAKESKDAGIGDISRTEFTDIKKTVSRDSKTIESEAEDLKTSDSEYADLKSSDLKTSESEAPDSKLIITIDKTRLKEKEMTEEKVTLESEYDMELYVLMRAKAGNKGWVCPVCNAENAYESRVCEVCGFRQ